MWWAFCLPIFHRKNLEAHSKQISMKKKIYLAMLVTIGAFFSLLLFNKVAFAIDRTCNTTCRAELLPKCISMSGTNAEIVESADGPSCGCQSGYEQDINGYCRTLSEVVAERALEAEKALISNACYSSNGEYAEVRNGVCGCKDGYQQFAGSKCQTIIVACSTWRVNNDQYILDCPYKSCSGTYISGRCVDLKKEAEEKVLEEDTKNTQQCIASRGENAEYKNFQCGCKDGYQAYIGNKCQTATEACQSWYGPSISTTADKTTCECERGYVLSGRQCVPLTQPVSVIPTAVPTPAPAIVPPSPTPTVITPKSLPIPKPTKKKPQPSIESEIKTPPISEITASTTNQEQIITTPTEAPEIVTSPTPAPVVKQVNVFQRVWRKFLSWF
jgi:hypothetical protein